MNYEAWISYRYLKTKKNFFLSVVNFVSVAGVAIGVAALMVVIGVMTGFDIDLKDKIVGTSPHVLVEKETGITDFNQLQNILKAIPGVQSVSPYVHGNVFLEEDGQSNGIVLRGINPSTEASVTKVNQYLQKEKNGNLPGGGVEHLKEDEIVIGSLLANYWGYQKGDDITLISPASGVSGQPWRYKLKVVGIFTSGMYDVDRNLVLVHLQKGQEIFSLPPDMISGIGIKLLDPNQAMNMKDQIYQTIGFNYFVRTWIDNNRSFFEALKLEKFAMFVILTLIVLVASFNIVSTLIVMVTSKVKDIGILKSMGVPKSSIRRIFTLSGIYIGFMGTLWGLAGGAVICFLLKKYQFIKIPQEVYAFDSLPVVLQLSDILMIVGCAMLISYLATIYPAAKAASLEPVEALRYE